RARRLAPSAPGCAGLAVPLGRRSGQMAGATHRVSREDRAGQSGSANDGHRRRTGEATARCGQRTNTAAPAKPEGPDPTRAFTPPKRALTAERNTGDLP